ncbi:hypothetical protein BDY21DRAFT_150017 [Lineolata rhizophorae]|uniref:DUF7708 domain-containing protein n=1 Tax=Lineolata rhizophorae TaxID=578093 RepID=A0A6A6NND6_9PEZI|nr:hypothetical protein BDY21DRAFT_150017 [Lineolata rhizophorae]
MPRKRDMFKRFLPSKPTSGIPSTTAPLSSAIPTTQIPQAGPVDSQSSHLTAPGDMSADPQSSRTAPAQTSRVPSPARQTTPDAQIQPQASQSTASSQLSPPPASSSSGPRRDLWEEALQTLPEDRRDAITSLSSAQTPQPGTLSARMDALIGETKQRQQECEKRSYKFTLNGREIILRDVAEKTITWLDIFKSIGDVAANFDPIHTALPWAGVRFLLQAAVGERDQMRGLLVGVERIVHVTSRCAVYEELYCVTPTPGGSLDNLQMALVKLYAVILQFLAQAHYMFGRHALQRAVHSVFRPGDIAGFLENCRESEQEVDLAASNCGQEWGRAAHAENKASMQALQTLLGDMKKPILRTDDRILALLQRVDQSERLEILDWISKVQHGENHDTVRESRTPSTCEWILQNRHYGEWQDASTSIILWLHENRKFYRILLASNSQVECANILSSRVREDVSNIESNR